MRSRKSDSTKRKVTSLVAHAAGARNIGVGFADVTRVGFADVTRVGFADVTRTRRESGAYVTQMLRANFPYDVMMATSWSC
jgi:hypothetical protein